MPRPRHEVTRLTPATVGSGYRPTAWCRHCHAPHDAGLTECPDCTQAAALPVLRMVPTAPLEGNLARLGVGTITALRAGRVVARHLFPDADPIDAAVLWDAMEGRR